MVAVRESCQEIMEKNTAYVLQMRLKESIEVYSKYKEDEVALDSLLSYDRFFFSLDASYFGSQEQTEEAESGASFMEKLHAMSAGSMLLSDDRFLFCLGASCFSSQEQREEVESEASFMEKIYVMSSNSTLFLGDRFLFSLGTSCFSSQEQMEIIEIEVSFLEKQCVMYPYNMLQFRLKKSSIAGLRYTVTRIKRLIYICPILYKILVWLGVKKLYNKIKLTIKGTERYE